MLGKFMPAFLFAAACGLVSAPSLAGSGGEAAQKVLIEVGNKKWRAAFADNATAREVIRRMPFEVRMEDLFGRELCHHFPDPMPADEIRFRGYEVGEIIYWAPMHSLVILYRQNGENFNMQSVGRIEGDVAGISTGDTVTVRFSLEK